ncbi:MAG: hypothetical protein H6Q59_103 [Firmicutes bacterium]|nr:hypothetical protein [Bacillota bacterium]
MRQKQLNGLAFFILIALFIIVIRLKEMPQSEGISIQNSGQVQSLELLTAMKNETAEDENSSQTSIDEVPDYTRMYPELYTVYSASLKTTLPKKVAYLTFDDGPSENTFKVLDILEENDIKATFFLVGSAIKKKNEDSLERMVHEGHTIGIHTYSHKCNEIYCSVERFLNDFNTVYQQIYDITGERVHIYRFPWGSNNSYSKNIKDALMEEMDRRGFTCYDWNVDTKDSVGKPSAYSILRNIRKDIKRQDHPIILMHDASVNDLSVQILPDVIKLLKELGYDFDSLDNREPYQFRW